MRKNLEFEYRAGNLTSYDITLLRGVRGVYGSDTPVRVRGCSLNRETRMEITHPTKPTKKMEVLVPWLLLEDEGGATASSETERLPIETPVPSPDHAESHSRSE